MCCFSGPVSVSGTNIFCRHLGAKQLLAYDMRYASDADVAMILPIPVPPGSGERAVRFIDLSGYDALFDDLHTAFEIPTRGGSYLADLSLANDASSLEVHTVGSFDASFVPSRKDFVRLDARFRIPDSAWAALPQYADWGFAVFKLKAATMLEPSHDGAVEAQDGVALGAGRVHTMAFEFPTRAPGQVFFPTVHIHDGQVHEYASFDHWLFLQLPEHQRPQSTVSDRFTPSERSADACVKIDRANGVVTARDPLYRLRYSGEALNEDIWAPLTG